MDNSLKISPQDMRAKVYALQAEIEKMPQADCPVVNHLLPGLLARQMTIPAGVTLVSAVHKTEHLCVVSKGRIAVMMDDGLKEFVAGDHIHSKPGAKRVGHAIEETIWTTFHPNPNNETNLEKLAEAIIESKHCELLGGSENKQLLHHLLKEKS